MTKRITVAASFVIALVMAGFSAGVYAEPVNSGFLHDYSNLKPAPKLPDVWDYEAPGLEPDKYMAVILPEIEIRISPDSPVTGFKPVQLAAITSELHRELVQVMEKKRTVTDTPGPGTAVVNTAITGVTLKKTKRGLLGYTPIGAVIRGVKTLAGENISIQNAQLEMSFVDSESGKVLATMVGLPDAKAAGKEETSWQDIENTIRHWASAIEARLNE